MSDRDRVLAYATALVAAFVLAFLAGRLAAPYVGGSEPEPEHHAAPVTGLGAYDAGWGLR